MIRSGTKLVFYYRRPESLKTVDDLLLDEPLAFAHTTSTGEVKHYNIKRYAECDCYGAKRSIWCAVPDKDQSIDECAYGEPMKRYTLSIVFYDNLFYF